MEKVLNGWLRLVVQGFFNGHQPYLSTSFLVNWNTIFKIAMSAAELYKAKLDLIAWISQLSDGKMIAYLEGLRVSELKADFWDELPESHKIEIQKGLDDIEKGNVMSSEEFWKRLKNAG